MLDGNERQGNSIALTGILMPKRISVGRRDGDIALATARHAELLLAVFESLEIINNYYPHSHHPNVKPMTAAATAIITKTSRCARSSSSRA